MKTVKLQGPLNIPAQAVEGKPRIVTMAAFADANGIEVKQVKAVELSDDLTLSVPDDLPDGAVQCNLFFDSKTIRGGLSLYNVRLDKGEKHAGGDQTAGVGEVGKRK